MCQGAGSGEETTGKVVYVVCVHYVCQYVCENLKIVAIAHAHVHLNVYTYTCVYIVYVCCTYVHVHVL